MFVHKLCFASSPECWLSLFLHLKKKKKVEEEEGKAVPLQA